MTIPRDLPEKIEELLMVALGGIGRSTDRAGTRTDSWTIAALQAL